MLALVAGQGNLPHTLIDSLDERPLVANLRGFEPNNVRLDMVFTLETAGTFLQTLKSRGITKVCFAGGIHRPSFDPQKMDDATKPLIPYILEGLKTGDNSALSVVIKVFEASGFKVIGAHELMPSLCPKAGILTTRQPSVQDIKDIKRAKTIHKVASDLDIGQSYVVSDGQVLAVEALAGTDKMLSDITPKPTYFPTGGVLYKSSKCNQDRRVDMATLGVKTIEKAAGAGLNGICVGAGDVLFLEPEKMTASANALDLFLCVEPTCT